MVVDIRSLALAVAVPVLVASLAACGTPESEVSAVSVAPVAAVEPPASAASVEPAMDLEAVDDASSTCPQDVRLLEALQIAHENIIGRPAESVAELEASGILSGNPPLAATIEGGEVVGATSVPCGIPTYADAGLEGRCAEELDRLAVDVLVGSLVAQYLGTALGPIEQAQEVGVDHGPYEVYGWDDRTRRLEPLDPACPDHDAVAAALRSATPERDGARCLDLRATLATASEAYEIEWGQPPLDEEQLVAGGFLREVTDQYDVGPDGSIVAQRGSDCEQFELAEWGASEPSEGGSTAMDCLAQRKALTTSVEAYWAQTGGPPVDEQMLIDQGFLRELSAGFDLLADGTVVAAPGGGCE